MSDIDLRSLTLEQLAARVHIAWVTSALAEGRPDLLVSANGENLMVPYEQLSDAAKVLHRATAVNIKVALKDVGGA